MNDQGCQNSVNVTYNLVEFPLHESVCAGLHFAMSDRIEMVILTWLETGQDYDFVGYNELILNYKILIY